LLYTRQFPTPKQSHRRPCPAIPAGPALGAAGSSSIEGQTYAHTTVQNSLRKGIIFASPKALTTRLPYKKFMKNADRPFIGILIITIAILYGMMAILS
jgi:hypothetical protein